jgi:hypothetical protein
MQQTGRFKYDASDPISTRKIMTIQSRPRVLASSRPGAALGLSAAVCSCNVGAGCCAKRGTVPRAIPPHERAVPQRLRLRAWRLSRGRWPARQDCPGRRSQTTPTSEPARESKRLIRPFTGMETTTATHRLPVEPHACGRLATLFVGSGCVANGDFSSTRAVSSCFQGRQRPRLRLPTRRYRSSVHIPAPASEKRRA